MLRVIRSVARRSHHFGGRSFASLVIKPRNQILRQIGGIQADSTSPFRDAPKSLAVEIPSNFADSHEVPPPGWTGYIARLLGFYSKEAKLIRGARFLYFRIAARADDEKFYEALKLEKKFRTTYSLLVLHVWMVLVRLRTEADGKEVGQTLYEVFTHDVEKRVVAAGVKVLVSKWLQELEKNFYGASLAYDKAIEPGAAPHALSHALWRNVFAEDGSEMPTGEGTAPIEDLARYLRREIESLKLTDSKLFLRGSIRFSSDFYDDFVSSTRR